MGDIISEINEDRGVMRDKFLEIEKLIGSYQRTDTLNILVNKSALLRLLSIVEGQERRIQQLERNQAQSNLEALLLQGINSGQSIDYNSEDLKDITKIVRDKIEKRGSVKNEAMWSVKDTTE